MTGFADVLLQATNLQEPRRRIPGSQMRLGVDVGGTFTDVVGVVEGRVVTAKVPKSSEQSEGVLAGIETLKIRYAADIEAFAHGTTVATNALLERKGARTALITTEGFRDVVEIGRQNRASLYDLTASRPPPLVAARPPFHGRRALRT